jgi:di/tricarboxylate transporter
LYEILVPPRSPLVGRSARDLGLRRHRGVTLLAVLRGSTPIGTRPERTRIRAGDELLLQGPRAAMADMEAEEQVILLDEIETGRLRLRRLALPLGVLVGVVALAATGWTSLAVAVLLGVTVLLVGRQLTVEEAVRAIELKVVVVVACVLPLGHAFESAGAVEPTARMLGALHALAGPWAVLAALFVATSALVQVVQKAAIALAVPLALAAAQATASDPAPFLMAVAIAGSCAFLTPLAHPVNLMVHAPGQYRFGDFLRVGLPLQIIVTVVAIVLIPILWPFGEGIAP